MDFSQLKTINDLIAIEELKKIISHTYSGIYNKIDDLKINMTKRYWDGKTCINIKDLNKLLNSYIIDKKEKTTEKKDEIKRYVKRCDETLTENRKRGYYHRIMPYFYI